MKTIAAACRGTPPRGYSLLFALSMVASLAVGAALLLQRMGGLGVTAGAAVNAAKTTQAAYAGATWGQAQLTALLGNGGTLNMSNLAAVPALSRNDAICADGLDCSKWYLLAAAQPIGDEGSKARVAFTCNPSACQTSIDDVINFQVRSFVTMPTGDTRLVEVTLATNE